MNARLERAVTESRLAAVQTATAATAATVSTAFSSPTASVKVNHYYDYY